MKNLPIFTVRSPQLSRWQSAIEKAVTDENPKMSIAEIRNTPVMQGCWLHVKKAMEGETIPKPVTDFDDTNIEHLAYASSYFFGAAMKIEESQDATAAKKDVDAWPFSTNDTLQWGLAGIKNWSEFVLFDTSLMYKDYKKEGGGDLNYSVVDWKIPKNGKVALIGDWGTGNDDAHEFLHALLSIDQDISKGLDPDISCIIHLGDIYYAGSIHECNKYFYDVIRTKIGSQVPVFTIPGNHDYYTHGHGFFHLIAKMNDDIPIQNAKQSASYFCLQSEDLTYQFVGLDTGYKDRHPAATLVKAPAPPLRKKDDYEWAIDKIKNFRGKTILLSHHQLFSRTGAGHSSSYKTSSTNPHLYKNFAPYFSNKIAAWYWGHEHSLAIFQDGAYGLNQGRLVGSSSYEQAISDGSYDDDYPMVPFSDKNVQLAPNAPYHDDDDADYYYPHAGAILQIRHNNNPTVHYYSYPSWKNEHRPANPKMELILDEKITNPTKSPHGVWVGDEKINHHDMQSDMAPALAYANHQLYIVYKNNNRDHHLYWDRLSYDVDSGTMSADNPRDLGVKIGSHPAMVKYNDMLYVVYKRNNDTDLEWCTCNPHTLQWTMKGRIEDSEKHSHDVKSEHGVTMTVFNGKIYLFYLNKDDEQTVMWATFDGNQWDYHGALMIHHHALISHHKVCPAVAANDTDLFLISAPHGHNDYTLNVFRLNQNGNWYDMGVVTNDGVINDSLPQTSETFAACADDRFLRILYRNTNDNKNICWATLDLGYYDIHDHFVKYDLNSLSLAAINNPDTPLKPTWAGGLPIICSNTDNMPNTQDFPGYCMNDEYSFCVYPNRSNDHFSAAIQRNY